MHRHHIALALLSLSLTAPAHAALRVLDSPTKNMSCVSGVCTATAAKAVLSTTDLASMLASGDVTIASGTLAQDIEIGAQVRWASPHRLTLDSFRAIAFNRPMTVEGTGALTITTNDGGTNGEFRFLDKGHVEFWDNSSSLIINGNAYTLANSIEEILASRALPRKNIAFTALARSFDLAGKNYKAAPIPWFRGIFEGLGNTISNLTVSDSKHACVGLFGCQNDITPSIRDIGVLNANVQGSVVNYQSVGALAGYSHGDIVGAYATGQVSGTGASSSVGGLVGAGIGNTIRFSHAAVTVSGSGHMTAVGGLAGSIVGDCVGGACEGLLEESYATGSATGGDGTEVGGLTGFNISSVIVNCYATGAASVGANGFVGGLIGFSEDDAAEKAVAIVQNSYSTGLVQRSADSSANGGLIGYDMAAGNRVHLYWDIDTSGISDPSRGAGLPFNDTGITGLTTAQLTSGLPIGFSTLYWTQNANVNGGFPYLKNLPPR